MPPSSVVSETLGLELSIGSLNGAPDLVKDAYDAVKGVPAAVNDVPAAVNSIPAAVNDVPAAVTDAIRAAKSAADFPLSVLDLFKNKTGPQSASKLEELERVTAQLSTDGLLPIVDLLFGTAQDKPIPPLILLKSQIIESEFGVDTANDNGRLKIFVRANGKDNHLLTVDATTNGISIARQHLTELQSRKAADIESKYKVRLAQKGEPVANQLIFSAGGQTPPRIGDMIHARAPRLDEMFAVEAALLRSQPSNITRDRSKPLKIYFVKDDVYANVDDLATYQRDRDDNPSIFIAPDATDLAPLTEKDAARDGKPPRSSIEAVLIHEFAHNGQNNMGWGNQQTEAYYAEKIGWQPQRGSSDVYLFKGDDGHLYKESDTDRSWWNRVDQDGNPLDQRGNRVEAANSAKLSFAQMREGALVKPATNYFSNPLEMFAEGMREFRLGLNHRAELLYRSPELYFAVSELEEKEISTFYGKGEDGLNRFVRNFEGKIVRNTAEIRAEIAGYEQQIVAKRNELVKASR